MLFLHPCQVQLDAGELNTSDLYFHGEEDMRTNVTKVYVYMYSFLLLFIFFTFHTIFPFAN